ncbi:hypothetical protein ES288_A09G094100v1 [Gossypium darwinii]|uniref:Reverse transcriptase zinc-binding domain-containing protein n=1 Tax=Gossypium darwinii TaxID=34276 RepID=A0A5D2FBE8_GOSDA|nr:hypothetical protein ES288_A09G094100v1 [Gossypium darwinii]
MRRIVTCWKKRINKIKERIQCLNVESENRELTELELKELRGLKLDIGESMKFKESIWRQKSRMYWFKEGDSNTAFFHRAMKIKAKRKSVYRMKIGNSWYCDPKVLKENMVNYFSYHFSYPLRNWKIDFVLNFRRLNESEARKLELPFSMEEIKEAVWSCDENKAPGPDGFNIFFKNMLGRRTK